MPLPFAPPPKDSSLYQQLESTTLQTMTADQLDTIRAKTFSQGTEGTEDEYRRILLLGLASNQVSMAGPIPGTQVLLDTDSISNSEITVYQPGVGEVFQLIASSISTLDGASSMMLKLGDDSGNPGAVIDSFNSTSDPLELNEPIYLTNEVWLKVRTSDASGGNARLATSLIRVR